MAIWINKKKYFVSSTHKTKTEAKKIAERRRRVDKKSVRVIPRSYGYDVVEERGY